MSNDPRLQLLRAPGATGIDLEALRGQALQLVETGHDADAQGVVDVLLALGDAHPTVLLAAAALAEARGELDKARQLVALCPQLPAEATEALGRWSGQ